MSGKKGKDDTPAEKAERKKVLERDLEEGLEESFPASDPPAASEPGPKE